jgi:hypothetical protein
MMSPFGTKFTGDKIVPQSDLRARTDSDRIIKKDVNRIVTWSVMLATIPDGKLPTNQKIEG